MNWGAIVKPSSTQSNHFNSFYIPSNGSETLKNTFRFESPNLCEKRVSYYWSKEEDRKLLKLAPKYKYDWDFISEKFSTKNSYQISNRWKNKLNPDIKKTKWTEEEDIVLKALVLELGYKWNTLVKCLKGRTEQDIKKRFKTRIMPELNQMELAEVKRLSDKNNRAMENSMEVDISTFNENDDVLTLKKKVMEWNRVMDETIKEIWMLEDKKVMPRELFNLS